ncbi:MAG: hypothetical protein H6R19_724 [Proteobacteria bacterium]|nr:hypothetical protein [Pseudomonadota bacterium]
MLPKMRYRLGLDLGAKSIGWAMLRLNAEGNPVAVIRAGVRIFPDGRNPDDGSSLAVTRREKRQMRRRRDRLLRRKERLSKALTDFGFFPADEFERRALVELDPYALRKKALYEALTPAEFARALFHINQRRGFKSNRKTDKKDNDSGALKTAIRRVREQMAACNAQTVGEWLANRHEQRQGVRARLRGKSVKEKAYDLYIDRSMVEAEFDAIWARQSEFDPTTFHEAARTALKDILLFQRPLKPVEPGRCTLLPEERRAPLALPSVQRFRIYQEVNNLRILGDSFQETQLSLVQRNLVVALLEKGSLTFTAMRKALKLPGTTKFNLEDSKRDRLKGNDSGIALSKEKCFGEHWFQFSPAMQEQIVDKLLTTESEAVLIEWLQKETGIAENAAEAIANAHLPEGFGNLSRAAISRVLPELEKEVITYAEAVVRAGFASHSALSHAEQNNGFKPMTTLPYYGEALQRHVAFGSGNPDDSPEKRYGRIANPTVHIGLNELRKVVNALIKRYGLPAEIVVEVARELKQGKAMRDEISKEQAKRQDENKQYRDKIRPLIGGADPSVLDVQRMRLWVELNRDDVANRRCPYTGEQISIDMLFSEVVEIEHILPFSRTLDDSLNNKTVALRRANRDKANKTPFEAFGNSPDSYDYAAILERAKLMPREKAKRFAPDGYQRWLKEDKDFLARALNDTAYLSRIAKEYLSLVCPPNKVRAIPGRLTAMLRGKYGLNELLSGSSEKNRNDHRHHALDAAVIAITDQGLLQRFSQANAQAREKGLQRLVEDMPLPWTTYREQVWRALQNIVVSFRPNHGYQGEMFDGTIYGLRGEGQVTARREIDGKFSRPILNRKVTKFSDKAPRNPLGEPRHGLHEDGTPNHYMGLWSRSNYCIEIVRTESGAWESEVIPRHLAYATVGNQPDNVVKLRNPTLSLSGKPLVFRMMIDDTLRVNYQAKDRVFRVTKISAEGGLTCTELNEANINNRYMAKLAAAKLKKDGKTFEATALNDQFILTKLSPSSLQAGQARPVTISPIGDLRDQGLPE